MKTIPVTMVRVYLTEAGGRMKDLLRYLHDDSKVHGVTVFRGITGFGGSGRYHSSTLLDTALDLPVVIEFFDAPDRAERVIEHVSGIVGPGHVVHWRASVNDGAAPEAEA